MYFRQFYLGCLAHASYLIGSGTEAAVVDPQRDIDIYLEDAKAQGLAIKHVIETHCHADFISGHHELAAHTGAKVYFGAQAAAKFEFVSVHDGDEIIMHNVTLRFLETPGHTPESVSVLVIDREKSATAPQAVLTGDAMFIGDVGRPDLLGSRMPATELAGMLYDSLHNKLLTLPDETKVFPAHGAGSMCGRNISSETSSTIGEQRRFNYALQPMPRDAFIKMIRIVGPVRFLGRQPDQAGDSTNYRCRRCRERDRSENTARARGARESFGLFERWRAGVASGSTAARNDGADPGRRAAASHGREVRRYRHRCSPASGMGYWSY